MIETSSAFSQISAPADGALRDASPLNSRRGEAKSGPGDGTAARRFPSDIVQLSASAARKAGDGAGDLTEDEKAVVADLKRQDAETRRHEQAHANAGGPYAGSPSYTYERGPDGRSYAVAGTTPIDVSPISGDAEATIRKMQTVKRAARAPAEPSAQDRKVAAQADAEMRAAQAEATAQSAPDAADETGPGKAGAPEHPGAPPAARTTGHDIAAYGGAGAGRPPNVSALLDLIA